MVGGCNSTSLVSFSILIYKLLLPILRPHLSYISCLSYILILSLLLLLSLCFTSFVGVARALQEQCLTEGVQYAGCSAGALTAVGLILGGDFDYAIELCKGDT